MAWEIKREGGSAYFIMNGEVVVGTIVKSNHCWCAQVLWGGPGGDMVFSHQSIDQVTGFVRGVEIAHDRWKEFHV